MGNISKRNANTTLFRSGLHDSAAEPPVPTPTELDCYIGRLEVTVASQTPEPQTLSEGKRDPYQFD